MIDTHCHLDDRRFQHDLSAVLQRARAQGVDQCLLAGVHHSRWQRQLEIQQNFRGPNYPGIYHAFGIHPWFCHEHQAYHYQQLAERLSQAVAVGECGLDGTRPAATRAMQEQCLLQQIYLAVDMGLPMIFHAVKSVERLLAILKPYPQVRGVVHGFAGSIEQANQVIRAGLYIGIGTRAVSVLSAKMQRMLTELPLSAILLESDAPDGLPQGVRNEPAHVRQVAAQLATLRNQDENLIVAASNRQAKELFRL